MSERERINALVAPIDARAIPEVIGQGDGATVASEDQRVLIAELKAMATRVDEQAERLAKLETALDQSLKYLDEANDLLEEEEVRGEEDGVGKIRAWIGQTRVVQLNDTKDDD